MRVLPHAPNFAPVGAIALYGGAAFRNRLSAFSIPIAALVLSDLFIGFYTLPIMLSVYGSFLLAVGIGRWVRRRQTVVTVLAGALGSSLSFFLATNAAVWAFGSLYPKTAAGLFASYVAGLPFYRNTLLSDVFYSGVFFGLTALVVYWMRRPSPGDRIQKPVRG